jgi:regulator of protease activity HflC (stomatin/prohibitin superfamily)
VGINIDSTTRSYDPKAIYGPGRYFLGIGHYFVVFPIDFQSVDFTYSEKVKDGGDRSLTVITKSGQSIYLDVSFYYRLDETKVVQLFQKYGSGVHQFLERESQDLLRITCSQYELEDFFYKRDEIASVMQSQLNDVIYEKYFCWIPSVQLRDISLTDDVEKARVELVVVSQTAKTAQLFREITLISKQTDLLKQSFTSNVTITINEANAQGQFLEQSAIAEGNKIIAETEATAWLNFTTTLGLNSTQLVTYNFLKYIKDFSSNMIVGFEGSVPIILG